MRRLFEPIPAPLAVLVVHPTCSMNHLGISAQLSEIASGLAVEADVPVGDTCCGTAGDRGLLHPELVCPRPETPRPCLIPGPRTRTFQQIELAKWAFCTRRDALTNRLSS
jgi:hypothetical protein